MAIDPSAPDVHGPGRTAASPATVATTLQGVLALLSLAAAVIHFAVMFEHFAEAWLYGAFFLALAWAQLAWAPLALWRPSRLAHLRAVMWTGVLVNAAVIALYLLSRTTGLAFFGDLGLPMPADAGDPEAFGGLDVVCCVYEALIIVGGISVAGMSRRTTRAISPAARRKQLVIAAIVIVALTTLYLTPHFAGPEGPAGMASGG